MNEDAPHPFGHIVGGGRCAAPNLGSVMCGAQFDSRNGGSVEPYDDDSKLRDENEPEYKEELFERMKYMGLGPEKLKNLKDREEYAAWLANEAQD